MIRLKSLLLLIVTISCSFLLTGCFDFIEDINIKSDGSGTIKATLNLSKSSTKVASLMKLKSVQGMDIPSKEKIQSETETMIAILKKTEGISNVAYSLDFTKYIASVSCSFSSVKALNAFSKSIASHFKTSIEGSNSYAFNAKTGVFSRSFTAPSKLNKEYTKISETDKKYFDDAFYTQIIRFDKTIKSQGNKSAKISSSSKSVLLKLKATDLVTGKTTLQNTITLNNK